MKVAIITAYCQEPPHILERCHRSVAAQSAPAGCEVSHYMIADGHPHPVVDAWSVTHIRIPPQRDCGETPRMIGAMLAISAGCEALSFLDADNWLEPRFVAEMTRKLADTNCDIVTCPRSLWRVDGSRMGPDEESDGVNSNDINCYLIPAATASVLNAIAFKKDRHECLIGDQLLWRHIKRARLDVRRVAAPLVNYVTNSAWHYLQRNETPPADAKYLVIDHEDGRAYECFYRDVQRLEDGTLFCPPELLMAPDGSRPNAADTAVRKHGRQ